MSGKVLAKPVGRWRIWRTQGREIGVGRRALALELFVLDCLPEFGDRAEDAVPDALVGDLREETLEEIEPAFADDDIGLHIERGEQRCGAMTLVGVRHRISNFKQYGVNQLSKMNE